MVCLLSCVLGLTLGGRVQTVYNLASCYLLVTILRVKLGAGYELGIEILSVYYLYSL